LKKRKTGNAGGRKKFRTGRFEKKGRCVKWQKGGMKVFAS